MRRITRSPLFAHFFSIYIFWDVMIVTYIRRVEVNRLKSNQALWKLAFQTYVRPKGTGPKEPFS